jgi:hypothetical protein
MPREVERIEAFERRRDQVPGRARSGRLGQEVERAISHVRRRSEQSA